MICQQNGGSSDRGCLPWSSPHKYQFLTSNKNAYELDIYRPLYEILFHAYRHLALLHLARALSD